MDKKYFFFDIDGTLTDNATHKIVPSAAKALHALQDNGHFVAIATGRAYYKAVAFADTVQINNLVCFGGGCLVKDGVIIDSTPLERDKAVRLLENADRDGLGWMLMLDDSDAVYFNNYWFLEQAGLRTELTTYHYDPDLDYHALKDILKVYVVMKKGTEQDHPWINDIGHLRITDQMVAVIAIFIELMKVDIIEAGAAVKHAVINDEPLEMKNAERFTGIHRDAINRHVNARIFLRRAAIPVSIGV